MVKAPSRLRNPAATATATATTFVFTQRVSASSYEKPSTTAGYALIYWGYRDGGGASVDAAPRTRMRLILSASTRPVNSAAWGDQWLSSWR